MKTYQDTIWKHFVLVHQVIEVDNLPKDFDIKDCYIIRYKNFAVALNTIPSDAIRVGDFIILDGLEWLVIPPNEFNRQYCEWDKYPVKRYKHKHRNWALMGFEWTGKEELPEEVKACQCSSCREENTNIVRADDTYADIGDYILSDGSDWCCMSKEMLEKWFTLEEVSE